MIHFNDIKIKWQHSLQVQLDFTHICHYANNNMEKQEQLLTTTDGDARALVLQELSALHEALDFIQKEVESIKQDVMALQTRILSVDNSGAPIATTARSDD